MGWSGLPPRAEKMGRGCSASLVSQRAATRNGELAVICWVWGCDLCKAQVKRPRVQVTMLSRRIARCSVLLGNKMGLLRTVGSVGSYSPEEVTPVLITGKVLQVAPLPQRGA